MAKSTAFLLYNYTEAIPEQPDDEQLKIVMQQIAEENASILSPGNQSKKICPPESSIFFYEGLATSSLQIHAHSKKLFDVHPRQFLFCL